MRREHRARIILVGCGKSKRDARSAAADLYTGSLFKARLAWVERQGVDWWILSAAFGLLSPGALISPYDATMKGLSKIDRVGWALSVAHDLVSSMSDNVDPQRVVIEIHAGVDYAEPLSEVLRACGFSTHLPVRGMGIGEQIGWYKRSVR